jgi:hypothetical protein
MKRFRNRRGSTLIEVIVSTGITVIILGATAAMTIATMRCYDTESAQCSSDNDAILAMQRIILDVREAASARPIANGERIRIILPTKVDLGNDDYYYDCSQNPDTAHQFDYYISDETGVPGHRGSCLWKGKNNNDRELIMRNVEYLYCEQPLDDIKKEIWITLRTIQNTSRGPRTTELTQRAVYMRNYKANG